MDRYRGPHTALIIALPVDPYFAIIMDSYRGPNRYLIIALHGGLYLAYIIDLYRGRHIALALGPLPTHYNGPLFRTPHSPYYNLAWRPLHS
jgi:hypothetical protein